MKFFNKKNGEMFLVVFLAVATVFVVTANRNRFGNIPLLTDFFDAVHEGTDG